MPALSLRSLSVALALASFTSFCSAENRSALARAKATILRDDVKSHVAVLADDTFEGRESGSRGGRAAGTYITKQLEALKLTPAGDGGTYFQSYSGTSRNILAMIEGSDPQLKREVIVLGAHYDHVGYGTQRNSYGPWGYIHNGADDNASGVAGLLEVAQAMMELEQRPARSILLAFWDGEEKGLLGSKHWVAVPTVELARVKTMINVDMIGRLTKDRVELYGTRTAPGFRAIVSEANREHALDLDFTWTIKDDSDHWPFFARNIPILMFHTGLHADYHRPSDDVERVNYEGGEQVSRFMFDTVHSLASIGKLPQFRAESRRENDHSRRQMEQAGAATPARLGLVWEVMKGEETNLKMRVATVHRNSAAATAGLRAGDVITQFGGQPITNEGLFRQQILAAPSQIEFTIERGMEPARPVIVKLLGGPIRVGLSWREDAGDPGAAIVTNVVFGSPAHVAGITVGDRVRAIEGMQLAKANDLSAAFDTANDSLALTTERRGQLKDVELKLLPRPEAPAP